MRELKLKAIFLGLGAYVMAWVAWNLVSSLALIDSETKLIETYKFIFHVFNLLAALIPGYVAASIAKSRPILHSVIAGFILAIAISLFWLSFGVLEKSSLSSFWFMPVFLIIMSSLGGVVAGWQLRRNS